MILIKLFWNPTEKRFRSLWRIMATVLIAGLLASVIAVILEQLDDLLQQSFLNLGILIAMLTAIYIGGRWIDKRSWKDFGIGLKPLRQFGLGILLGGALVGSIVGTQWALCWLQLDQLTYNRFPTTAFLWVLAGQVFRYLCGSIFEEAFSRGYLLINLSEGFRGWLTKRKAILLAYFITSVLFGILHLANDHAQWIAGINLCLLGLLFGWMVIRTGNLAFATGLHAAWNIAQNNIFGFANSGKQTIASLYTFRNTGDPLWTGGDFGIEGGLICTILLLLVLGIWTLPFWFGGKSLDLKLGVKI